MEFLNPFEKKFETVFVSDFFAQEITGGAELTTEALIRSAPCKVYKIKSNNLTKEIIQNNSEKFWIFGNFANLNLNLIPLIIDKLNYSVIEYDYKFCKYRSAQKHEFIEKSKCNCETTQIANFIESFFVSAKKVWWMSNSQMTVQTAKLPKLKQSNSEVLSSIFDVETIDLILKLRGSDIIRNKALIFDSPNWLKGTSNCINWCKLNNVEFTLVKDVDYRDMLRIMRMHHTLVYLPNAMDTCPRMVIEAKLLGCDLVLNNNVQHKDESWFNGDVNATLNYLKTRTDVFWTSITSL